MSLKTLANIAVPIYEKLGIRTGKSKTLLFDYSIQVILVKLLCSLVKNNYPLKEIHEATDGLILSATIPSTLTIFEGEIIILLEEKSFKTKVSVDAKIKGQLFHWGISESVIKTLLFDIDEIEVG